MKLETIDFNLPAEVQWRTPSPYRATGHYKRHFSSLRHAIRFVIEDLTDFPQSTASVHTQAAALTFEQISWLYSEICMRAVAAS